MAELKTTANDTSVNTFLQAIPDDQKRLDAFELLKLMEDVTQCPPVMWGSSIVGFGRYHYKYASGHEGDMCLIGFAPRKQALTLYISGGFDRYETFMQRLGSYKAGKGCLYIKRLSDVNTAILKDLFYASIDYLKATYPD